jgi:hypothetical protein
MTRKALISKIEPVETGYRVAQVVDYDKIFQVNSNLIWVDCDDTIVADKFWYDDTNKTFNAIVEPESDLGTV